MVQVITSATPMAVPNLMQIRTWGFWANERNITNLFKNVFISVFRELIYRSDPSTDFHAFDGSNDADSCMGVPFGFL